MDAVHVGHCSPAFAIAPRDTAPRTASGAVGAGERRRVWSRWLPFSPSEVSAFDASSNVSRRESLSGMGKPKRRASVMGKDRGGELLTLNPNDRVWMPRLGYGVDSIEKREETQGLAVSGTVTSTKRFHKRWRPRHCHWDLVSQYTNRWQSVHFPVPTAIFGPARGIRLRALRFATFKTWRTEG